MPTGENLVLLDEGAAAESFAQLYQEAALAFETLDAPVATEVAKTDKNPVEETESDKKLSPDDAMAGLLLFLLSQQMPAADAPPDLHTDGSDDEGQAAEAAEAVKTAAEPQESQGHPLKTNKADSALLNALETLENEDAQVGRPIHASEAEGESAPIQATQTEASGAAQVTKDSLNNLLRQGLPSPPTPLPQVGEGRNAAFDWATQSFPKKTEHLENAAAAAPAAAKPQAAESAIATLPASAENKPQQRAEPTDNPAPRLQLSLATAAAPDSARPPAPPTEAQNAALPLRNPQFSEMLARRVMWLSSQNLQEAHIQLEPAELGKLSVQVTLAHGQAEVGLASPQAEVRAVLEGQLPRLQEMLENQGLNAPRLGIFDAPGGQAREQGSRQPRGSSKAAASTQSEESLALPGIIRHGQTLVDYYA